MAPNLLALIRGPRLSAALAAGALAAGGFAAEPVDSGPPRKLRSESFLGVHFDFHARTIDHGIGRHTTPAMVERIIDLVRPDYIQIDCKGHFGVSSYPTRVGHAAPDIAGDPLRTWREVTARRGVALYMHYSGVADDRAIAVRPEWAAIAADGKRSSRATSLFGSYVDELLIPQLRELADVYRVDGAWIDGDCWAAIPDYSPAAVQAFTAATGVKDVPKSAAEPHWREFMAFNRERFRQYLRHYVTELKRTHPGFQIASNWAHSAHMPEPVFAPVDFLSGDYSPQNAVNSARFQARALEGRGLPWDLMCWAFVQAKATDAKGVVVPRGHPNHVKSVPQLQQEAAVVLARGGGFQGYFIQQADGSIYNWQMPMMAEVARFCREREAICHRAIAVPQVAVLLSAASHYRQSPRLFAPVSPTMTAARGVLQSLLDSQFSVQLLTEDQLAGGMSNWPVIVVPETEYLEPTFRAELLEYARNGGQLLLVGAKPADAFRAELEFETLDRGSANVSAHLYHHGRMAVMVTDWSHVRLATEDRAFGRLYRHDNPRSTPDPERGVYGPAGTLVPYGRGRIAATFVNFGERHLNGRTSVARDYLAALLRHLFPEPMVEVTGSHTVDVNVMRQGGRLAINLVNTAGPHEQENVYVFDEVPAVGPLTVRTRLPAAPKRVTLEPGGRAASADYRGGVLTVNIPRLPIHEIVAIDP